MSDSKKILVTGGEGFIGKKVVEKLQAMGHEAYPYDIVNGDDLMDMDKLDRAVQGADIVYHIAAEADLTKMSGNPAEGYVGVMKNVYATHNVAYLCATHRKWLIYASTVCVYGNQKEHPETEDTTLPNPSELYACSKYAGEWIVKGYGLNYGMPWTIQRYATIYGEGMREALGLHIFFRQAMTGQPITVHGDGLQDRTLTFIDDLVEGIVAPLNNPEKAQGQIFNLTAPTPISAIKMAEDVRDLVAKHTDAKKVNIVHIDQRENQTFHEDFSVSKAKDLLGWEAKTSWEDGLEKTYWWMRKELGDD